MKRNPLYPEFLTREEAEKLFALKSGVAVEVEGLHRAIRRVQTIKGDPGPKGEKGDTGPSGGGAIEFSLLANEDLPAYVTVTSAGMRADSSVDAHRRRVVGVTKVAIASGFTGVVTSGGPVTNPAWSWSGPGALVFLNGITLSETAPESGWSQKIGIAVNPSTIIVELDDPVLL